MLKKTTAVLWLVLALMIRFGAGIPSGKASADALPQQPAEIWVVYGNGGLRMEIEPEYNDLITAETPADDSYGLLFIVCETASLEAGRYDGAGWLFSIGKVSEERLHELLCYDMSGMRVFARDETGQYYIYYHPTDVRFERATAEEYESGLKQWSMLCEWAWNLPDRFAENNGLETVSFGNTEIDMALARAAYMPEKEATLSTAEYGPVGLSEVDGRPYAEAVMQGRFTETDADETPEGEYITLDFPEMNLRADFFFAPGGYARAVSWGRETLYQATEYDDDVSFAEIMQDWYDAAAEQAGIRPAG